VSGKDPLPQAQAYEGVKATNPPNLIKSVRAPTTNDRKYPIGTLWINTLTSVSYQLVTAPGIWTILGSAVGGDIQSLTGGSGGALLPTLGNINILGTANQITSTGAVSTITFSIPAAFIAPGSIASTTTITAGTGLVVTAGGAAVTGTTTINTSGAATTTIGTGGTGAVAIGNATGNTAVTGSLTASTTLTATLGAITATNGNLVLGTAGNKILSTSVGATSAAGANSFGTVTLSGGTVTVATTAVNAASIIFLTRMSVGATGANDLGMLSVGTIVAATSFVINAWTVTNATALQADDVSVIGWMIVN